MANRPLPPAPVRAIAAKAGVGVGTVYRHFPQRSDLIKAVIQREVDACVEAASSLAAAQAPGEALASWMQRLVDLVATQSVAWALRFIRVIRRTSRFRTMS